VSWTSDSTAVATIDAGGFATGVSAGTAGITAGLGGVSGTATLTVTVLVLTSITVMPATPTILAGGTQQFAATGIYSDGSTSDLTGQVSWTSDSTAVATIDAGGLATGVSAGRPASRPGWAVSAAPRR